MTRITLGLLILVVEGIILLVSGETVSTGVELPKRSEELNLPFANDDSSRLDTNSTSEGFSQTENGSLPKSQQKTTAEVTENSSLSESTESKSKLQDLIEQTDQNVPEATDEIADGFRSETKESNSNQPVVTEDNSTPNTDQNESKPKLPLIKKSPDNSLSKEGSLEALKGKSPSDKVKTKSNTQDSGIETNDFEFVPDSQTINPQTAVEGIEDSTERKSVSSAGTEIKDTAENTSSAVSSNDLLQSRPNYEKRTSLSPPKSTSRKRSLNSTSDTKFNDELTSPFPQTADATSIVESNPDAHETLIDGESSIDTERDSIYTDESSSVINGSDGKITNTMPTIIKESHEDMEGRKSVVTSAPLSAPHHSSDLGKKESPDDYEGYFVRIGELKSEVEELYDNYTEKPMIIQKGSMDSASTKVPTEDDSRLKHEGYGEDESNVGVTFDPDGMKNDGPQDPDSIVFSLTSDNQQIVGHVTDATDILDDSEPEFETFVEKNSNEEKVIGNRTGAFERLEHVHPDTKKVPFPSVLPFDLANDRGSYTEHVSAPTAEVSSVGSINPLPPGKGTEFREKIHTSGGYSEILEYEDEMLGDAPDMHEKGPVSRPEDATSKISENQTLAVPIPVLKESELGDTNTSSNFPTKATIQKATVSPNTHHTGGDSLEQANREFEDTSTAMAEDKNLESSGLMTPYTEQSVIRPVKVKISSPPDMSVSTSILSGSYSTEGNEFSTVPSVPVAGSEIPASDKVENSSMDTSSPVILSNPDVDAGMLPELVDPTSDQNVSGSVETSNGANSSIAGIAVRTSVSVNLPLSINGSQSSQKLETGDPLNSSNIPLVPVNLTSELFANNDSSLSTPSTDGLTPTTPTEATGFRIRKPKLKINGAEEGTSRAPWPFTPSLKRPSSTAGPPVSIFKKARTRIASITSSTTARPLRKFSTIRIQYASGVPGMGPGGELVISTEPVTTTTTTMATTTTEEYISEEPFTDQTHVPSVSSEDDVTLVKVAGYISVRGLRWNDLLSNRRSTEYRETADMMHLHLERVFRSSPIASRLWKIEIDGFSGSKTTRPVGVDFFLYLIKSNVNIGPDHLAMVFHEKLSTNNTFYKFRVDTTKTSFEMLQEEPLNKPTPAPEENREEPPIPQWAIAVIVIGAASLIFIVLFAAVTLYGRHHMRRRYTSRLSEEEVDKSSGEWESKMAAAYENMAADTIYEAQTDTYKKSYILD